MIGNKMKIGVVGYSSGKFDETKATMLVDVGITYLMRQRPWSLKDTTIVSGYTNLGIPKIAYEWAKQRGCTTMGIACAKAEEYDLFPVDVPIIVGKEWGDESSYFLSEIDCLLRVGGGPQSLTEVATFRKEYPTKWILELELAREA